MVEIIGLACGERHALPRSVHTYEQARLRNFHTKVVEKACVSRVVRSDSCIANT